MIILDFIKTDEMINGKLLKRKCVIRRTKGSMNHERECLGYSSMRELLKLHNIEGEDSSYHENTIGCNHWHNGINCLLDPECSKKTIDTNKQEFNILFHTENCKLPKVAILISIPTQIIRQDYANKRVYHKDISKILINMIPQEVKDIYEEYLRRELAK